MKKQTKTKTSCAFCGVRTLDENIHMLYGSPACPNCGDDGALYIAVRNRLSQSYHPNDGKWVENVVRTLEDKLEAAQNKKRCDGCKFWNPSVYGCEGLGVETPKDFYCKSHEAIQ